MLRGAITQDLDLLHKAAAPRLPIEMVQPDQSASEKASRQLVTGAGATYSRSVCLPGIISALSEVKMKGGGRKPKQEAGFSGKVWKGYR